MVSPIPASQLLLLLAALAGLLGRQEVVAEPAEEEGARCPEGLWPLPPKALPRVTYTQVRPGQAECVAFLYHPCAHSLLKRQLFLLARVCVTKPTLIPDSSLTQDRPLMLIAWGTSLEMARVEPAWAVHWLRRRKWWKQRKKVILRSDTLSGSSPSVSAFSQGTLCWRGCVQAPTLAFAVRSWRPPGTEVPSRGHRWPFLHGAKRRELRAALGLQPTPSGLRAPSASPWSLKAQQPIVGTLGEGGNASAVTPTSLLPVGPGSNASSRQLHNGQGSPVGCACPSQASLAPQAAAPPRAARGPTPRTEEAAWAAMALTFLLVLLTLATLCTRLHRNFRRSESIYWGPTSDSQDTVAAVLKRRLLFPSRRVRRSRRRPLLPPSRDSGPDSESSD